MTEAAATTSARAAAEEALLDAAERLLVEVGYAGITTRRLAEEAGVNHGLVHYYFGSNENLLVRALERFTERLIARQRELYAADMVLPNLFLNVHPDYVNSQLMFPTVPEIVRMVYDWLFEARHLPLPEADLQHYVALWDITNRQDARNCEWQQAGLQSRAFRHGVYVPQEFDAHRFADWVRRGLGSSASPASR